MLCSCKQKREPAAGRERAKCEVHCAGETRTKAGGFGRTFHDVIDLKLIDRGDS